MITKKRVIVICGKKGGGGKTTVSTNLAAIRNQEESSNLLAIDADRQQSFSAWVATRNKEESLQDILVVQKIGEDIPKTVKALNENYKDIILDVAGADNEELRWSMLIATKIVIPMQASQFDVWTIAAMDKLISEVKIYNKDVEVVVVPNRISTNPSVNEINELKELLEDCTNLKISNSILHERIAYRKAPKKGQSVIELGVDEKANKEIINLYKEVFND